VALRPRTLAIEQEPDRLLEGLPRCGTRKPEPAGSAHQRVGRIEQLVRGEMLHRIRCSADTRNTGVERRFSTVSKLAAVTCRKSSRRDMATARCRCGTSRRVSSMSAWRI